MPGGPGMQMGGVPMGGMPGMPGMGAAPPPPPLTQQVARLHPVALSRTATKQKHRHSIAFFFSGRLNGLEYDWIPYHSWHEGTLVHH